MTQCSCYCSLSRSGHNGLVYQRNVGVQVAFKNCHSRQLARGCLMPVERRSAHQAFRRWRKKIFRFYLELLQSYVFHAYVQHKLRKLYDLQHWSQISLAASFDCRECSSAVRDMLQCSFYKAIIINTMNCSLFTILLSLKTPYCRQFQPAQRNH